MDLSTAAERIGLASGQVQPSRLKEMDAARLTCALLREGREAGIDQHLLSDVVEFAASLHKDQKRSWRAGFPKTPYIEHPLRVALRLVRLGVSEPSLIAAAVLHDTVEDCSKVFVKDYLQMEPGETGECRTLLSQFIEQRYGPTTAEYVLSVTNPVADKLTHTQYQQNVREEIATSPKTYLLKFGDFFDNAGSLHYQDREGNEKMVYRLASKYYPLISDFEQNLYSVEHLIQSRGSDYIQTSLNKLQTRLVVILDKYGEAN